jgi:signal transduction histidine kinase
VDAVPDALLVVDAGGTVRFANVCAERLLRRDGALLVGESASLLLPGVLDAVARTLADRAQPLRVELLATCADGVEVAVDARLSRFEDSGEELVLVVLSDDTERPSLQDASARMRDELFASVSHELRTPLTSILGYTEILVDMGEHGVSGQAAELLAVIERNAERELRLVEDLLTLAALGGTGLRVTPAPTDLAPVVAEVLQELAPSATGAGVLLRHTGTEELWVSGDAHRLRQVVSKLVGNAIKFTPTGGSVGVALSTEGGHAVLCVENQGVGVAPHELPRLFDGLFRGAHAVSAHLPGAGLGLPIVKGIVDAHGGEIDVESEHGEGTRVLVRLPLAD